MTIITDQISSDLSSDPTTPTANGQSKQPWILRPQKNTALQKHSTAQHSTVQHIAAPVKATQRNICVPPKKTRTDFSNRPNKLRNQPKTLISGCQNWKEAPFRISRRCKKSQMARPKIDQKSTKHSQKATAKIDLGVPKMKGSSVSNCAAIKKITNQPKIDQTRSEIDRTI